MLPVPSEVIVIIHNSGLWSANVATDCCQLWLEVK